MQKLSSTDPESRSADLVADNIARLRALFPELISEGPNGIAIQMDVLKSLVGDRTVTDAEEKYGLNWHGKRLARQLALTPSTGTLRPFPEESVDWDKTRNLMIEGDNLEVLKLLQKSYAGKVKLIYIDPPYNTGKDFVYPDNFHNSIEHYLQLTGQKGEAGEKLSSNTETSGRFHTDWLNMMYPRLKLARNLLREDGVIFVSIADHEIHNLRALMDEVFGDENFVATVIWQKVFSPKNSARHFSEDHDYVVVYARTGADWTPKLLPRTEEMEARYANPDNDPRGPWTSGDLSARNYYGEGIYPITCPTGRIIDGPPPGTYWRVSPAKFKDLDQDGRIWWGADKGNTPRLKRFLSEVKAGRVPQTLWTYEEVGHTQEAKKELNATLGATASDSVFETPKPTKLIRRMLQLGTASSAGDIVVDFFGGSGSTHHAVLLQNLEDGGNRRCVLVQLPEPMPAGKVGELGTIADVTKERLRKAGELVLAEWRGKQKSPDSQGELLPEATPELSAPPDCGFRVFKLDSTNIREWDPKPKKDDGTTAETALQASLDEGVEHLKAKRTEPDILFELLLKLGLDLCVPMEVRSIAGKDVHSIGAGSLLVCLAQRVGRDEVEALALGIAGWHGELKPAGETTVVFRDSAFEDDVAKTNLAAILNQHGLETVRSL
jgi:adenine-specific DNA-methyltransferase